MAELFGKFGDPFVDDGLCIAGVHFIGKALVFEQHQHIAVNEAAQAGEEHEGRDFEARVVFVASEAEGNDGDVIEPHIVERFSKQENVV